MIKTYTLESGQSFKTFTIPAGTVLFRGINISPENREEFMREFFNAGSCVPPTKLVYFYPAPYAGLAVNKFNVYIMYTLNYDIELLLLIKPATQFKSDGSEEDPSSVNLLTLCTKLSSKNACDRKVSPDDPCLTPEFITSFPHILGYIGIDAGDADRFGLIYRGMVRHKMTDRIIQILPSLVENIRGLNAVPEIAIHPLHLRMNYKVIFKYNFSQPDARMKGLHRYRARYNYVPLLYITGKRTYALEELFDSSLVDEIIDAPQVEFITGDVFAQQEMVMKAFLGEGYVVNGKRMKLFIDPRTGFYTFANPNRRVKPEPMAEDDFIEYEWPHEESTTTRLQYSVFEDPEYIKRHNLNDEWALELRERSFNSTLKSLEKTIVFDKGQYRKQYRLSNVFPRPDLGKLWSGQKNLQRRVTRRGRR